ncbi:MAG: hypothetical protein ACI841_002850, partial [Planctomycetota bacterium]
MAVNATGYEFYSDSTYEPPADVVGLTEFREWCPFDVRFHESYVGLDRFLTANMPSPGWMRVGDCCYVFNAEGDLIGFT